MGKWCVEMVYGIGFTAEVDANSREEAIETAKRLVEEVNTLTSSSGLDCGDLEFEQVTYAQEDLRV